MHRYSFSGHPLALKFEKWARENLRPSLLERDKQRRFDRTLWDQLAKEGFFQLLVPKEFGGQAHTAKDYLAALSGLAKGSLDLPFLLSVAAHGGASVALISEYGTVPQKKNYLPKMGSGESIAALCNAEENAGTDILAIRSKFEWTNDTQGTLNVIKPMISNITQAGVMFVSAWCLPKNGAGKPKLEVFVVSPREGLTQHPQTEIAGFLTGSTGSLYIENVPLTYADSRIGGDASGITVLKYCFALERIFISTIITGVLAELVELALKHTSTKKAFGKSLSEFQYIQSKVLQIFGTAAQVDAYAYRLLNDDTLLSLNGFPLQDILLSDLKLQAVEKGFQSTLHFFEIFGGQGFREDHIAQKLLRDMLAFKALGGTEEQQRIVIFQNLLKEMDTELGESHVKESNRKAG